jgi:glyoxylase-like metal-dependent hydrolase (beta-lactamase superfamily II)
MSTTFKIADLTLHRIVEQQGPLAPITAVFPGVTPEILAENRGWLQPWALSADDQMIAAIQSYVVRTPHHTILIDSCVGNDKSRPGRPAWDKKQDGTYMAALGAAGVTVEDIDIVMCTHLHVDHVGWNTKLLDGRWVPTFPNARYVFGQTEYAHWEGLNAKEASPIFNESVLPIVEAGRADLVATDFAIGDHVRLLPTPGHTPGHFAVLLGKTGNEAVVTGDLIHSPIQTRYPDLSPGFDTDPVQAAATRRAFLERFCDTETLCCTIHFPSPSAGLIKRWGDGFKCEMISG